MSAELASVIPAGRPATLVAGGARSRVLLRRGSRLAPAVTFETGRPASGAVFDGLLLEEEGREEALGRCRFDAIPTAPDHGRLVFLDHVYDAEALVADGRVVDLRGFFQNLPMVIAQKEQVRPAFRELVADTLFDLSVWKKFLDEQDRVFAGEPRPVAQAGQEAVIRAEGPAFFARLDRHMDDLGALVRDFDREEHERHGFYLRRQAWNVILASEFMKRCNLKPRGYAGDAEMMRMLYENRARGRFLYNRLLHLHPVSKPASEAVRSRRRMIAATLRTIADARPAPRALRVLSVAAGPAWELRDVIRSPEDAARISVVLLDQDPEALALARASAEETGAAIGAPLRVDYVTDSVRTMLRGRGLAERLGTFDVVYSMGLFDYLTPPVARAVLSRLFGLLAPGGVLLVGNYHVQNPSRVYMEYWLDWSLYHRTEGSFLELADGLPAARREVTFEETGCQMFLRLERAG
jgi:extracellular factor (EF) 3-hydroxypalmitic acid methyl ester biosynthesis protein